jgi:hypothetical protein
MNKKIELEKCPVCGSAMEITYWDPPLIKPSRNGKYCLCCNDCGLLFGWDIDYGCQYDKKELAVREWNSGQAFRYKRMWEKLREQLPALKKKVNIGGLTKEAIFYNIAQYMDYIEETADNQEEP